MANDYATDVLTAQIDSALAEQSPGLSKCPAHDAMEAKLNLLLRCQRAQLTQAQKATTLSGIISVTLSTIVAVVAMAIHRIVGTP